MNVSKQIARIERLQNKYVEIQRDIHDRIKAIDKPVEKYIKKRLKDQFPDAEEFHVLTSFQCGSLTNKWQPQAFLYHVNGLTYSSEGYWYSDTIDGFAKHSPPVPTRRLLVFLKALSDEIGVKITLVRRKPYWLYEKQHNDQYQDLLHREEILIC
jgi:hypothetical protein